jgi:hypothetical protein
MTTRIAQSELTRKGIRYRATDDGRFFLAATARIPSGRSIAANNFLDMVLLSPLVDVIAYSLSTNTPLEDSGSSNMTAEVRAWDATTAVASAHGTGLDSTNLAASTTTAFQNGATGTVRAEKTGANGSGTFIWVPSSSGANSDGNVTIPNFSPRAYPLTGTQNPNGSYPLAPQTGTRLVRVRFPAAPTTQTAAAATTRLLTLTLECAPARVNTPVQVAYDFAKAGASHGLVSP